MAKPLMRVFQPVDLPIERLLMNSRPAGTQSISLNVNGKTARLTLDDPATPLLYALRNDLGLHGPRFGCGLGQCGACTVHLDGAAIRSCVFPAVAAAGRNIVTLEGLGTPENPHPLQQAFIDEQAVQCGDP